MGLRTVNFHAYLSPLKDISPFNHLQENPSASYFVLPGRADCSPIATPGLQLGFDSSEMGELKTKMSLWWWTVPHAQPSLWKGDDPLPPSSQSSTVTCLQPQNTPPSLCSNKMCILWYRIIRTVLGSTFNVFYSGAVKWDSSIETSSICLGESTQNHGR